MKVWISKYDHYLDYQDGNDLELSKRRNIEFKDVAHTKSQMRNTDEISIRVLSSRFSLGLDIMGSILNLLEGQFSGEDQWQRYYHDDEIREDVGLWFNQLPPTQIRVGDVLIQLRTR